ncbi:hypothetical protein LCM23_06360 [Cytobacillus kochii]|uniref:hypothetical protein n=1 Tax=Cytobacillus kochii TaxID=859143 RepID=UPI001CD3E287|nr:hypothetical protein [Cytobacillus kochii]MCA1025708.1 hypothetical protein [Cytobacillus kochii]
MEFTIKFGKIGFSFSIGKESKRHKQIHNFSISKIWFDDNGDVDFAKDVFSI